MFRNFLFFFSRYFSMLVTSYGTIALSILCGRMVSMNSDPNSSKYWWRF